MDSPDLSKIRDETLKELEFIELRMDELKRQIADELDGKSIVTSDPEFDDPGTDPRYEYSKYRSSTGIVKKEEVKPTLNSQLSNVKGLYKGTNMSNINENRIPTNHEEIQRKRMEKQLNFEKERKKAFRSNEDTKKALSLMDQTQERKNFLELSKQRQKEEDNARSLEPFRSGFGPLEYTPINYEEIVTSNLYRGREIYDLLKDPGFDSYSRMYISKRYIIKYDVVKQFGGTKVYTIKHMLQTSSIKGKEFLTNSNFILVAMISQKSDSLMTQNGRGKYIRMILTDFHHEIMLLLFGDAYAKYWKLPVGSIIAILNPEIEDKYHRHNGKQVHTENDYLLRVNYDSSILEYAKARDYGTCSFRGCKTTINITKGRYCVYHQEKRADKAASNRPEMGTNYRLMAPINADGNREAIIMTAQQLEQRELLQTYKENNPYKTGGGGLAIANVKSNPPVKKNPMSIPTTKMMLVTDFSDPQTISNLKTEEEKSRKYFSSVDASQAFRHANVSNEKALIKQEKGRELDKKLRKRKMMDDPQLLKQHEKVKKAEELKKRKTQLGLELRKTLDEASKTEKSLKKDRATVNAIIKTRDTVEDQTSEYRKKKAKRPVFDGIDVSPRRSAIQSREKEVHLSSDSDDSDSEFSD